MSACIENVLALGARVCMSNACMHGEKSVFFVMAACIKKNVPLLGAIICMSNACMHGREDAISSCLHAKTKECLFLLPGSACQMHACMEKVFVRSAVKCRNKEKCAFSECRGLHLKCMHAMREKFFFFSKSACTEETVLVLSGRIWM